jgi:undecaprenyl diphosphate synthase
MAANYGGRWDILQAVNRMLLSEPGKKRREWTESDLAPHLAMSYAPEPDLFIRTGGEQRISNFLLWQLAYSEFYFTDLLWPEFDATCFRCRAGLFSAARTSLRTNQRAAAWRFSCDHRISDELAYRCLGRG